MNSSVKICIEYEGVSYFFKNDSNMDMNMFYDKCLYIVKNNKVPNIEHIANILVYKKHYGVIYPQAIESKLIV
mgnify:CR=1 FL=1